jgi:predicted peptidase
MKGTVLSVFMLAFAAMPSAAQDMVDGFIGRTHTRSRNVTMPYRLFVPTGYDGARQYPLVLWLHGGGSSGTNNIGQISLDNRLGTHFWTTKENQQKYGAFVLAPQSRGAWDNNTDKELSEELHLALEILDAVRKEYSIDSSRLYVAGQSNGGIGVWGLITKRPGLFAAAIPICGAGNPSLAENAAKTAVWAFHGERDDIIPPSHSREMIAALKKAGGDPRYTEYRRTGHEIWERVFKERQLAEWLFAQRRPEK